MGKHRGKRPMQANTRRITSEELAAGAMERFASTLQALSADPREEVADEADAARLRPHLARLGDGQDAPKPLGQPNVETLAAMREADELVAQRQARNSRRPGHRHSRISMET